MKTCLRFLFALMFVAMGFNASAQTWVGSEAAAGDYYLLNVGTQEFLCGGNSWGTQASSGMKGIYVTLASQGEGKYTISTDKVYPGRYLGENGYVDNENAYGWTFALVDAEKKIYSISKGGSNFVGNTSPAKGCAFGVDLANASSTGAQWMLISKANLQASLASATYAQGIDVTFLITNPDMARIAEKRGWSWSGQDFNLFGENNYQREGFELYAGWASGLPSNLSQVITGIPNGKYRLMVDGFYRDGGNGEACTDHKNGTESLDMKLYINETTASIMSVFEGVGKNGSVGADTELGKVPNSAADAVSYFNAGLYKDNYVDAMVTNGQMTMGLKNDARTANNWGAFRNFRLYYYGVDLTDLKNTLAELKTEAFNYIQSGNPMNYYLMALDTAYGNAEAAKDGTQAEIEKATEDLSVALTEAKASEEVKARIIAAAAYNNAIKDNADPFAADPDAYSAAITKVSLLQWSETATMEEAEIALAELEAARQVFVMGAYPMDPTNGFDLTFMIKNAGFEGGMKTTGGTMNEPNDWTVACTTEGNVDGCLQGATPTEGSNYYNAWAATLKSMDLFQEIANLPVGKYRLTADVRTERADQITNQGVYATPAGGTMVKSATLTGVGNPWNGQDAWQTLSVEFNVIAEGSNTRIGISSTSSTGSSTGWFQVDNFTLTSLGVDLTELKTALTDLRTEVLNYIMGGGAPMGYYMIALNEAYMASEEVLTTGGKDELQQATSLLSSAYVEAKKSEPIGKALTNAVQLCLNILDNANVIYSDLDAYEEVVIAARNVAMSETATMEEAEKAIEDLEAARREFVVGATPKDPSVCTFDMTFLVPDAAVTDASKWTNGRTNSGEQYDSAPDNTYLDIWNSKTDINQTITDLPDGIYLLTATTRASADIAEAYIYGQGMGDKVTATAHHVGNTGNDLGRGWGWTTTDSILVAGGTLKIGFYADASNSKWAGADDFKLILARGLNDEEMMQIELAKFEKAQEDLKALIAEAQALINDETNIGTGAFQRSQDDLYMLSMYVQMAQSAATGSIGDVGGAEMVNMYASYVSNGINYAKMLNAPAADEAFEVEITTNDNYVFKNLPLTFKEDGKGGAFFNTKMDNRNYAQSVIFTATGEVNEYTMSTVNAAGEMVYIATNKTANNEGNVSQIRLTKDAEKALKVVVELTAEEGVYKLYNTEAKAYLGCQDSDGTKDGGLYTTNSHSTFTLTSVSKVEVALNITEAGWATLMLPYAAEVPADVTVYTCQEAAAAEGGYSVLTLTEVEAIEANKPYVVAGAADTEVTFEGWGAAYAMEYSNGMLTGTFAEKTAAAGSYVLQNQNGIVGFYLVEEGAEPTVKANRAWMNYSEAAGIKAFVFDGMLTGINQIEGDDTLVDVYTLQGVLVRKDVKKSAALKGLNKGAYIVGGVKTLVK